MNPYLEQYRQLIEQQAVTGSTGPPSISAARHLVTADVAVVGGVAGSALAIVLAGAGVKVAVVERDRQFRDRMRGEVLVPWGASSIAKLGVNDILPLSGAHPLPVWQTYTDRKARPPHDWRINSHTGDGLWGINHSRL